MSTIPLPLSPKEVSDMLQQSNSPAIVIYGLRVISGHAHTKIHISDDGLYQIKPDTRQRWSSGNLAHKFAARGGFVKTGTTLYSAGLNLFRNKAHAEEWLKYLFEYVHKQEKEVNQIIQENKDYLSSYVLS